MLVLSTLLVFPFLRETLAAPAGLARRSVTALSATELSSFTPFTQFARAAYCSTSRLSGWNCGGAFP